MSSFFIRKSFKFKEIEKTKNNYKGSLVISKIINGTYFNNLSFPILDNNHKNNNDKFDIIMNFTGKLFWKNETTLGLNKILDEIRLYKTPQIYFDNKTDFLKKEAPKISLVITLHNQDKYIKYIYSSIQRQEIKDIEILFVDDASIDNTTVIIKDLMERDKRIIYLRNNITKRAFYSRNRGISEAKGEYILVIDPDDLLINNILVKAYEIAKQYELDIVQFYALKGYFESPELWIELKYKDGILKNNSEIKNNFYKCKSRNLWDKLVRNNIYKDSIKFMKKEFYNQLYFVNNDDTAFFGLLHVARTYGFLEQIGYFYITRPKGSYYYRTDPKNMNKIFLSLFNNMKYFYIQSDNNTLEKNLLVYGYFEKCMKFFGQYIHDLTEGFDTILDVFDLYLNSSYFNQSQKVKIAYFKFKFVERKNNILFQYHNISYKFFL